MNKEKRDSFTALLEKMITDREITVVGARKILSFVTNDNLCKCGKQATETGAYGDNYCNSCYKQAVAE